MLEMIPIHICYLHTPMNEIEGLNNARNGDHLHWMGVWVHVFTLYDSGCVNAAIYGTTAFVERNLLHV